MPVSKKRKSKRTRTAVTVLGPNGNSILSPMGPFGDPSKYTGGNELLNIKNRKYLGIDPNVAANDNKKVSSRKVKKGKSRNA